MVTAVAIAALALALAGPGAARTAASAQGAEPARFALAPEALPPAWQGGARLEQQEFSRVIEIDGRQQQIAGIDYVTTLTADGAQVEARIEVFGNADDAQRAASLLEVFQSNPGGPLYDSAWYTDRNDLSDSRLLDHGGAARADPDHWVLRYDAAIADLRVTGGATTVAPLRRLASIWLDGIGGGGMTLRADVRRVLTGETVTLPVWIDQATGLANMNFNVLYDSNVVQAGKIVRGAFLPRRTLYESNPAEAGTIRIGLADSRDLSGSGPLAQIVFRAVGRPGSESPVRLEVTTISDAAGTRPAVRTVDGLIEIVDDQAIVPGDGNGNGMPDAGDAMDALKMSVDLIPERSVCDLDRDGRVTSTDARLILAKAVGK